MTPNTDPLLQKASATLAAKLGGEVSIGVGNKQNDSFAVPVDGGSPDEITNLLITLKAPGVDANPKATQEKILNALAEVPAITAVAQTTPDEKLANTVWNQLKGIAEGTQFDKRLLNWTGFNADVEKKGEERDFSVKVPRWEDTAFGVEFNISVPRGEGTAQGPVVDKVAESIKSRLPAIKELLTKRVAKYTEQNMRKEGKSEDEIKLVLSKLPEAIQKLNIAVNADSGSGDNSITIALRSDQQVEAKKNAPSDGSMPDNADALRASNPLSALSHALTDDEKKANPEASPQLNKALGRAFLFGGDNAMDVFPLIAGRKDMKTAIAKELQGVIKNNPEKAEAAKQILESDLFKAHDWDAAPNATGTAKPAPIFSKDATKENEMQVWLTLPKDKVPETLQALAAGMDAPAQQPQAAPADTLPTQSANDASMTAPPAAAQPQTAAQAPATAPEAQEEKPGWLIQKLTHAAPSLVPKSWVERVQRSDAAAANDASMQPQHKLA